MQNEIEAHIEKLAAKDCCWRITFDTGVRMTFYKPRELAEAEAKRYGVIVKKERRVGPDWVEVRTEA